MEIKVKKTTATAGETSATIELTKGLNLSETVKNRIKNDVGQYLVESVLSTVNKSKSPVDGGEWAYPSLKSKEYKKKKIDEGLSGKADMENSGDLLDALTFEETDDGIKLGWFGEQAPKADGHNNFSGKSDLPRRQSLPDVDQEFIPSIQKKIEEIVADSLADGLEFDTADFESVSTKAELYETLDEYFPDLSRAEIKTVIARSPELARLLDDLDLLDLL